MRRIDLKRANVARADTIRSINRQIILNYVRERAPISRGDISHETALQRSTISRIVGELMEDGLVEEIEGESTGGRRPTLLRLRAAGPVAMGVAVGTTHSIIATSDLGGRVLEQLEFPTARNSEEMLERIIGRIRKLMKGKIRGSIEGIGISLPGLVDYETGSVLFIPYFKWRDWDVKRAVEDATGLPVVIDNDANAAALAELWFGRPEIREVRDFILVLVEEGLGTGIVIDRQIYRGESGASGEFGHMTIGSTAPISCASGSRDCWEAFACERTAIARYEKLSRAAGPGQEVTFPQLIDRAFEGERAARSALLRTAHYLGVGIANLIKGLSPEAVIVGGRIVRAWPLLAGDLKKAVAESSTCRGLPPPRIDVSSLGEQPELMGALSLVLAGKFASVATA